MKGNVIMVLFLLFCLNFFTQAHAQDYKLFINHGCMNMVDFNISFWAKTKKDKLSLSRAVDEVFSDRYGREWRSNPDFCSDALKLGLQKFWEETAIEYYHNRYTKRK